jgi:hypothetical protein
MIAALQTTALLVIIMGAVQEYFRHAAAAKNLPHMSKSPSLQVDWMVIDERCWRVSTSTVKMRVRRSGLDLFFKRASQSSMAIDLYQRRFLAVVAASSRL